MRRRRIPDGELHRLDRRFWLILALVTLVLGSLCVLEILKVGRG